MTWYYASAGESRGPIPGDEFAQLVAQGVIQPDTLVWTEGMTHWLPLKDVPPPSPPAVDVASAGDPLSPIQTPAAPGIRCDACLKGFPAEELVTLGGSRVCATCKPLFLQRISEGSLSWDGLRPGTLIPEGPAHGALSEDELLQREYDIPAVELFSQAGRLIFQEPGTLLAGGVIAILTMIGFQMVPYIGFVIQAFFVGPIAGGLTIAFLRRLRGGQMNIGDVFCGFGPRFWPLCLAYLVPWLISTACYVPAMFLFMGGVMLPSFQAGGGGGLGASTIAIVAGAGVLYFVGILAGMYFTIRWIYTVTLVADRGYRFWPAMSLSGRMVSKHFWQHLWFFFLSGIISTLGAFLCCVGILAALPIVALASVILYERLFHGLRPQGVPRHYP